MLWVVGCSGSSFEMLECGGLGSERERALTASGTGSTQVPPGTDPAAETGTQFRGQTLVCAHCPAQFALHHGDLGLRRTDGSTDITTSNLSLRWQLSNLMPWLFQRPKRLNPFPLDQHGQLRGTDYDTPCLHWFLHCRNYDLRFVSRRPGQPLDF